MKISRFTFAVLVVATMFFARGVRAERLAVERFSTDAGLAGEHVTAIVADSRGFLWIGTTEGLSRFDGAEFRNYGTRDGLPDDTVHAVVEDRAGRIWVATDGGVAYLDWTSQRGAPAFHRLAMSGSEVTALALADDGALWAATGTSIFRIDTRAAALNVKAEKTFAGSDEITALATASAGDLWIATNNGLWRRFADGRFHHYEMGGSGEGGVHGLGVDRNGVVWIGSEGILAFRPDDGSDGRPLRDRLTFAGEVDLREQWHRPVRSGEVIRYARDSRGPFETLSAGPAETPDGTLWIATPYAVGRFGAQTWSMLAEESGLSFDELTAIGVDSSGAVWLGTISDGVIRVRPEGMVSYSSADGMLHKRVSQVLEFPDGKLVVASESGRTLQRLDGTHFSGVRLAAPGQLWGWGWNQTIVADGNGDLWIGTNGLLRYRNVKSLDDLAKRMPRRYTVADGLSGDDVFRVWADRKGDLWIGTFGTETVAKFDRATEKFVAFPPQDGLPHNAPTAFAEDKRGGVWIGLYDGGVSRYRDGKFRFFGASGGVPPGFVHALLVDSRGALWIATSRGGVCVADEIDGDDFHCRRIGRENGLSSNTARALVEAADGAIWVGTNRGVDRIDPQNGSISHFSRGDGLANNLVTTAYRDRRGVLWFGTVEGVSALSTIPRKSDTSGRMLITSVTVDGAPLAVSELGSISIGGLDLQPATERVEIGFVAPLIQQSRAVRYLYRLSGLHEAWTETTERVARFDRLPHRRFVFEVRALAGDGSETGAARVTFQIVKPVWMRPWFIVLVLMVTIAVLAALYRMRVAHLLELERMRTRIATDLHDDFGSSLSRISILTEVARRNAGSESQAGAILEDIGSSARSLIGALGDNIWAIDPRVDDLQSLVARVRHHAGEMLQAAGIAPDFHVQEGLESVHLTPVQRRQIYLILKEALTNVARHSGARRAVVSIQLHGDSLIVEIVDDGRGLNACEVGLKEGGSGGRGIGSMRARATELGGRLEIAASPAQGTTLVAEIPLRRRRFVRRSTAARTSS